MTPTLTSFLVWGAWLSMVVGSFLILEVLALKDAGQWNTLTWTIRQMFVRSQLFGLVFVGLIAVFITHLFWKRAKRNEIERRR